MAEFTHEQCEAALRTRDVIGQAKGAIRVRDRVDEADAFGQLIVQSQRTNTPLRVVAEELMDSLPTQ